MNVPYVLIILNILATPHAPHAPVTTQVFDSYGSCQAAASLINTKFEKEISYCVRK